MLSLASGCYLTRSGLPNPQGMGVWRLSPIIIVRRCVNVQQTSVPSHRARGEHEMKQSAAVAVPFIPRRRLYPLAEAAQLLGVSTRQVYNYIARGELHARKVGKRQMVADAAIETFINNLPEAS